MYHYLSHNAGSAMAAYASPSGFSYAQAAKGAAQHTTSQSSSSKVTSGTATPSTGALTELTPGGNWADDVEASVGEKTGGAQKKESEDSKSAQPKDVAVERTKTEDKSQGGPSGTSSPDLTGSTSSAAKEDEASSAPNEPAPESMWDTKSQASEPAWIADRKERQNGHHSSEKQAKGDKKTKETPTPAPAKPIVLQPAAPPQFNVWAQRAETQKAKMAALPKPMASSPSQQPALKENRSPVNGSRRKADSIPSIPREATATFNDESNKPAGSKSVASDSRSDSPLTGSTKATSTDRESEKASITSPPPVKDAIQWPTPDSVPEKERKTVTDKDSDSRADDTTPTVKSKKTQWQTLPVTPKYVEPADLRSSKPRGPSNNDRSGRNANGPKGRGPNRGTSNPATATDREREASRSNSTPNNNDNQTKDGLSVTGDGSASAKQPRASSTSPLGQLKKDLLPERAFGRRMPKDPAQPETNTQDVSKTLSSKNGSTSKPFPETHVREPKRMSPNGQKEDDIRFPQPIPRRNSAGTHTDETTESMDNSNRDTPSTRPGQQDGRKESARDAALPSRSSKRGGRGRGGNPARDLANGHQAHSPYNGYTAEFPNGQFGAQSPNFQDARGNHQFTYPPPRGGFRGNPRSQSIPVDNYWNPNARGGFSPHQMHDIQNFMHPMYNMNYPMSAMPYTPQMETDNLIAMVGKQMDYYFSDENLYKDMFLRKHMDSQGFVFLEFIANFNRLKQLTEDKEILKAACMQSQVIEIWVGEDGKERLRPRVKLEGLIYPMDQRDPSAQTEGPKELHRPQRPQLFLNGIPPQWQGPASAGLPNMHQRYDRRSYDSGYHAAQYGYPQHQFGAYGGYPEMYPESINGDEPRGRSAKSPNHENVMSPMESALVTGLENADFEPDSFPDEQISSLTVVVKNLNDQKSSAEQKAPYHSAASRTFSNGSIDSHTVMTEIPNPTDSKSHASPNGETLANGTDRLSLSRTLSPNKPQPKETSTSDAESRVFWVKGQEYPVQNLPSDLSPEPYFQLRQRAIQDRERAVAGNTPYDLDILYQFWSHFLLRNFNNSMYSDFKHYAHEDARQRNSVAGLKNLVTFYQQSLLKNPIRDRVAKDYVELVKNEPSGLEGTAFKTLRSAWRDGALNLKNRKKLADILDGQLKEQLDSKEKS